MKCEDNKEFEQQITNFINNCGNDDNDKYEDIT